MHGLELDFGFDSMSTKHIFLPKEHLMGRIFSQSGNKAESLVWIPVQPTSSSFSRDFPFKIKIKISELLSSDLVFG